MIESRVPSSGRVSVPPAVREALGLKPGDRLRYEIDGDQVSLSKADDIFSDEELQLIITQALADSENDEGVPLERAMSIVDARIEELARRSDAA